MSKGHGLVALADALGSGHRINLDWLDDAKCRQTIEVHNGKEFIQVVDPDAWAAPKGDDDASVRALRSVCAQCPVRRECLLWALSSPHSIEFGVYAGTVGAQRMALRNDARIVEKLTAWMDGWSKAKDKTAYERKERRKKWNQQKLEALSK